MFNTLLLAISPRLSPLIGWSRLTSPGDTQVYVSTKAAQSLEGRTRVNISAARWYRDSDTNTIMAPGLRGDFAEDCKLENYYICPDPLCSDDIWLALNDYTLSYNRQLDEKMIIFFCEADGRFV